jgi:hypothetical protein
MKDQIFIFLLFCIFTMFSSSDGIFAQTTEQEDANYDSYDWRIQQDYLFNTYIPANEQEAFQELEMKSDKESLNKFANVPEDSIRGRLQMSLGQWLRKNWQLHEGSRLSHHLKSYGVTHPDDMVELLIIGFHRYLNSREIQAQNLSDRLVERRKKNYFESRKKDSAKVIFTDTIRPVDD